MDKEERFNYYINKKDDRNWFIDDRVKEEEITTFKGVVQVLNQQDQRIAELEEQLKNAIVPKFKVGQEVYVICDPNRIVSGWKIADYEYYKQQYIIENKDGIDWIHKDRIFATKEEAEAKLKELQGE